MSHSTQQELDIAIILLNFNGWQDTVTCLDSLRRADLGSHKVYLIDNGSTNDSVARIQQWQSETGFFGATYEYGLDRESLPIDDSDHIFIINHNNDGFAGGNNIGIALAQLNGVDHILLLNNDTEVTASFLKPLREFLYQNPGAALTPQIRYFDRPDTLWNCGGYLKWPMRVQYLFARQSVSKVTQSVYPLTFITGCALLFDVSKTGPLTEHFFFGEEDVEFSKRLGRLGVPMYCIADSVIYHKVGTTLKRTARKIEIYVLKRLVNTRQQTGRFTTWAAYLYYSLVLLRRLTLESGIPAMEALKRTQRVVALSRKLDEVNKTLCVDYVRGEQVQLSSTPILE